MVLARTGSWIRRSAGGALITVLLGSLLAGCGSDDGDDSSASSSSPPASTSSAASASSPTTGSSPSSADDGGSDDGGNASVPPFPANTEPDVQPASTGASGTVTAIRIGRHEGYDRVVFEFAGAGTPGWDVRYTDQPSRQGSGQAVDLPGDATLQVSITGVGYPPDTGIQEYPGPQRLAADDTEDVTEVFFDGTFEGVTAALVGVETETPFRVHLLENPARVVLEVADPS